MREGTFRARATGSTIHNETGDVRFGRSNQGNEQIAVRLEIVEGDLQGEKTWWLGNFANDEAIDITVRDLRALGARLDDGRITDLEGLGSKEVSINVKEEEYQGKKRWRVSLGGGNFKFNNALDVGGLASLEARLRGGIVAAQQRVSPNGAASGGASAKAVEDDIGF
jgi:hypothetical protein